MAPVKKWPDGIESIVSIALDGNGSEVKVTFNATDWQYKEYRVVEDK